MTSRHQDLAGVAQVWVCFSGTPGISVGSPCVVIWAQGLGCEALVLVGPREVAVFIQDTSWSPVSSDRYRGGTSWSAWPGALTVPSPTAHISTRLVATRSLLLDRPPHAGHLLCEAFLTPQPPQFPVPLVPGALSAHLVTCPHPHLELAAPGAAGVWGTGTRLPHLCFWLTWQSACLPHLVPTCPQW